MDERTLTALEGSIKKWEAIVAGTGVDAGPKNCPLCQAFHEDFLSPDNKGNGCRGCPVYEKTGEYGCGGSPYDAYEDTDDEEEKQYAAEQELEFLKSLRPNSSGDQRGNG